MFKLGFLANAEIKENETKNSTQKIISEKKQIEQNNQTEQKKEIKVIEDNKNQNVEEEVQSLSKSQIEELLTEAQNLYNQKKYKRRRLCYRIWEINLNNYVYQMDLQGNKLLL